MKMEKKLLFLYPRFPHTFWTFNHALKFQRKRSAYPPLGLLTISPLFPAEWERRLVDVNVEPLKQRDLEWADVAFISGMLSQKQSVIDLAARCRQAGLPVVIGGPITSVLDCSAFADAVVQGEAEELVASLAADLAGGELKPAYRAAQLPSLAHCPVPQWSLLKQRHYSAMAVQYSRGCPFNCEFCDIIEIYGRRPRTKAPEQMLAELDALFRGGWRGTVFLVDDNFIGNKRNVMQFLPLLADWNQSRRYPFRFLTEASLNLAEDDELLRLMQRANFNSVFLGIETPVEASLREANKLQNTRRDLVESVEKIHRYGMEVMGGFIVGFDHDPPNVFEEQLRFIRESAIPIAMVGILTAVPNTQLYRRLLREGRLITDSTGDNTDGSLNFIPRMSAEALIEGYRSLVKHIYSPEEYYQRVLKFLGQRGPVAAQTIRTCLSDYLAAATSLLKQGILDRSRAAYWRFLLTALGRHRDSFGEAVKFAILGYHLRRMAESFES